MAEYFNVTTNLGDAEIANAISTATKLNITHIAFGDGGGSVPTPSKARTTLIKEVHRQAVTKYERHATNANWIVIETIIPSNIGGFTIREMGIIANNKLISHGSHAPFEKVADPSGVSEYRLRFVQNITDASVVSIILDQSLIYATQAWVEENFIKRNEIVDNLTTDDANKPVSAKQAKNLQDNKLNANQRGVILGVASLDENKKVPISELYEASTTQQGITQLVNDLTAGGANKALTAEAGKLFFNMFTNLLTLTGYQKIANPLNPDKPLILQWGQTPLSFGNSGAIRFNYPISFTEKSFVFIQDIGSSSILKTNWKIGSQDLSSCTYFPIGSTDSSLSYFGNIFVVGW